MLKPSDIKIDKNPDPRQCAELEDHADRAIRQAVISGDWPAKVTQLRMQIDQKAVDAVGEKYAAAGWKLVAGERGCYFTLDHPDNLK